MSGLAKYPEGQALRRGTAWWAKCRQTQIDPYTSSDEAMQQIEEMLLKYGLVKTGDKVILTLGVPVLERGKTNALRVYTIGREDVHRLAESDLPLRCREISDKPV